MTLMKLELNFSDLCQLALVVIALIELFRDRKHKSEPPPAKVSAHFFKSN